MSEIESAQLTERHDTTDFDSGKPELDGWLRSHANRAQLQGTARTTAWTAPDSNAVVGYYSICPTLVSRGDLTSSLAGGAATSPGYLIARLALHRRLHGQQLGAQLLLDALEMCVRASDLGGGRLIVVDALDVDAEQFYEHHGFKPTKVSRRLVMKVSTARTSLEPGN